MRSFRFITAVCILLLICLFPTAAFADAQARTTVYIANHTLNAHRHPDTSSEVLGVMSYGEDMSLVSFNNGWAKIRNSHGETGFCRLNGLTTSNPNNVNCTMYALCSAPVYAKPDSSSRHLGDVKAGDALSVLAETPDGAWYRVYRGSKYGYISTSALHASPFAFILDGGFGG